MKGDYRIVPIEEAIDVIGERINNRRPGKMAGWAEMIRSGQAVFVEGIEPKAIGSYRKYLRQHYGVETASRTAEYEGVKGVFLIPKPEE